MHSLEEGLEQLDSDEVVRRVLHCQHRDLSVHLTRDGGPAGVGTNAQWICTGSWVCCLFGHYPPLMSVTMSGDIYML